MPRENPILRLHASLLRKRSTSQLHSTCRASFSAIGCFLASVFVVSACSGGGGGSGSPPVSNSPLVVDTTLDSGSAPVGTLTLRQALSDAASGQPITFDPMLDGATIELSIVGEAHSILKGEVMGIRDEPSGPVSYLVGYFDRDYG